MEWSNGQTCELIDDYHNSPELWDVSTAVYKDNRLKNDKLKELSVKYNTTVLEVKKKLRNLRTAFHREHKKLMGKKSGSKKCKWFCYEPLTFLLNVNVPKSALSTACSVEDVLEVYNEGGESVNLADNKVKSREKWNFIAQAEGCDDIENIVPSCSTSSSSSHNFNKSTQREIPNRKLDDTRTDEAYTTKRDASTVYGEYIASKHRRYSRHTQNVVEHMFSEILFDADMGKFEASTPHFMDHNENPS